MKFLRVLKRAFLIAWCQVYHERHHERFIAGADMAYARYTICKKCGVKNIESDAIVGKEDLERKLKDVMIRRQKRT